MKIRLLTIVFLMTILFSPPLFATDSLHIGGASIPLEFAAENGLSESVRSAIAEDLSRCFSFAQAVTNVISTTNGVVEFREFEIPRPIPSALDDGLLWHDSAIVVGTNLCAVYRGVMESGTNSIPDSASLDTLLSALNSTNVAALPVQDARNLFWMPPEPDAPSDEEVRSVLSECASLRFFHPSLLAFRPGTSLPDGTIPIREAPIVVSERASGRLFNVFGIVLVNETWKLYLF